MKCYRRGCNNDSVRSLGGNVFCEEHTRSVRETFEQLKDKRGEKQPQPRAEVPTSSAGDERNEGVALSEPSESDQLSKQNKVAFAPVATQKPQQATTSNRGLELPKELGPDTGKVHLDAVFANHTREQLLGMCAAMPIEQLDFCRPGSSDLMNRAASVSLLMTRYLAGKDKPREYGDNIIPRFLAQLERHDASGIHGQVAIQLEPLGGELAAGGREGEALRCFMILSQTVFGQAIASRVSGYIFAMRSNIALRSKAKEDVEAALQQFDSLPPSEREQFAPVVPKLRSLVTPSVAPTKANSSEERLRALVTTVLAAPKMSMSLARDTLFNELVPKLAWRKPADIQKDFASWGAILGARDLELVKCASQDELKYFVYPVLEGYSIHQDDQYTIALDSEAYVVAIAVHNAGSMAGRVMIIPMWRSYAKYYSVR